MLIHSEAYVFPTLYLFRTPRLKLSPSHVTMPASHQTNYPIHVVSAKEDADMYRYKLLPFD